jgi:hypothetical protein
MNPRELVDHIRSGPAELVLDNPLRFRRRARSNLCDFNEFLQALQSSETLQYVECYSQLDLGISDDEWVLLVKTLGSIKGIQNLSLDCAQISRDFHSFQAVAEAVNSAHSLRELVVRLDDATFLGDSSGLTALASALREHKSLEDFTWVDWCPLLRVHRAVPLILCSRNYQLVPPSNEFTSIPNALVLTLSEIYSSYQRTQN